MSNSIVTKEWLTVTSRIVAAEVLIIQNNWFLSIGTSNVLNRWTFIWNYFNCIVLNASGHGAVAQ